MPLQAGLSSSDAEWLEADGPGGIASGTVAGSRTCRHHALLLAATTPPTGRMVLVNGIEAWVETAGGRYALTTQHYAPGVNDPDGRDRLAEFAPEPWPRWAFRCEDGTGVTQEIATVHDALCTLLRWRRTRGEVAARLVIRPLLSGRDYHALHHENPDFGFMPEIEGALLVWRPYPGVPAIALTSNGLYRHEPV